MKINLSNRARAGLNVCQGRLHLSNERRVGYFATNNTAALQADETRNRQILERIPAGRWGHPDDLGGAAIFLASSAADYIHGTTLPVDGGWLSR